MKLIWLVFFLFVQGSHATPLSCLEAVSTPARVENIPLYQEFEKLLTEWDQVPTEDRVNERRLSPKIKKLALKILQTEGVKAIESWDYKRILIIQAVKNVSDWNDFAHMMKTQYGVKVVYDPMTLRAQKAGALYVDKSRTLYISNEVILKLYKIKNLKLWNTSNENHEATHAIVSYLQRMKIWHPLWAELKTDSDTFVMHETYDNYLALDEWITNYEQILEETSELRLAEGTTEEMVNFLFPVLQSIIQVGSTNVLYFKDFKSKGFETEWKLTKKENRFTISSEGMSLELVLPYRKQMKESEAIELAESQVNKIIEISEKLSETLKRADAARLKKNWKEMHSIMEAGHHWVSLSRLLSEERVRALRARLVD